MVRVRYAPGTRISDIIGAFESHSRFEGSLREPPTAIGRGKGLELTGRTDKMAYTRSDSGTLTLTLRPGEGVELKSKKDGEPSAKLALKASKGLDIEILKHSIAEAVASGAEATVTVPFAVGEKARPGDALVEVSVDATNGDGKRIRLKAVVNVLIQG